MRHFITTHTIQGKNGLQKAIIAEVEKWEGTLIEDGGSKTDCIDHFKSTIGEIIVELHLDADETIEFFHYQGLI